MGPGTTFEFTIKLIELLHDKKQAEEVAKLLILRCKPSFYTE
jgi:hypothetical protein